MNLYQTSNTDIIISSCAELDNSFQRLSSLLTVHAPKLSVLVTPLRAAILQVWVWSGMGVHVCCAICVLILF